MVSTARKTNSNNVKNEQIGRLNMILIGEKTFTLPASLFCVMLFTLCGKHSKISSLHLFEPIGIVPICVAGSIVAVSTRGKSTTKFISERYVSATCEYGLNVSVCTAQRKIFLITYVFDVMQFDNRLQLFFNCSYRGSMSYQLELSNLLHRAFTCSKSARETLEQGVKIVQS